MTLNVPGNFSRRFQQAINEFIIVQPTLYNYFKANGLRHSVPEGTERYTIFDRKVPVNPQIGYGIHNPNAVEPKFASTNVYLFTLSSRIKIDLKSRDVYRDARFGGGDLVAETVRSVMPVFAGKVDQFLAWGYELKAKAPTTTIPLELKSGLSDKTGILNGGTAITAGLDDDENMTAFGDYIATVVTMENALRAAGFNTAPYPLISDLTTQKQAELGSNFNSTVGITDRDRVEAKDYVQKPWLASSNFIDTSGVKYRMALFAPMVQDRRGVIRKTMELLEGYKFKVQPQHAGGVSNNFYETDVIWSGCFVEHYSTAIQRTATLTLT